MYSEELVDKICEKIATSNKGLHAICAENESFPAYSTIFKWLNEDDKKSFVDKYARAREAQAEFLADEIITISDDGTNDYMTITKGDKEYNVEDREVTNRSKLRVDARKWKASKLAPKKFGEKLDVTTGGDKINRAPVDLSKLSEQELILYRELAAKISPPESNT